MSSLSAKDRASLCSFYFLRWPPLLHLLALPTIPRFARTTPKKKPAPAPQKKLGKDLGYFFSGDYLSACDLSTPWAASSPPLSAAM